MNESNVFQTVKKNDLTLARIQAELARRFGSDVVAYRTADGTVVLGEYRREGSGLTFHEAGTLVRLDDTLRAIRESEGSIPDDMVTRALAAFARGQGF